MANVPLPLGFNAIESFPQQRETLINLFNAGNGVIRRPGIESKASGSGACRGSIVFNEILYKVLGTDLTRINSNNSTSVVGTIAGTADVVMEPGFTFVSIIVKGGLGYTLSTAETLTQITSVNFKTSIDLTIINSITVYCPQDGGPLFFSDPNDPGTIEATSFFDAELLPDRNVGCFNFNNDLYVLGLDSGEIFRQKGDSTTPFLRVDGAAIQVGYVSGRTLFAPSFAFIGRDRGESFSIRIMGQGSAPKISNSAVDEFLNEEYTGAELLDAVGESFEWKGHTILVFHLARHSLAYMGGNWFFIESGINGASAPGAWRGRHISFAYNKYYIGDANTGDVGILADTPLEYGDKMEYSLDTFVRGGKYSDFTINNLTLTCLTGKATPEGTIGLTISTDGVVWQTDNTVWRGLGKVGQYNLLIDWTLPGGLGTYDSFAGIRLRSTANVDFALEALSVDIQ